jgi:hypothetical protein
MTGYPQAMGEFGVLSAGSALFVAIAGVPVRLGQCFIFEEG